MTARLWRPWDENDNTEKGIEKGTEKDIDKKAISEKMQKAALNVRLYLSQNGKIPHRIKETSKALKLHRNTLKRIIKTDLYRKAKEE